MAGRVAPVPPFVDLPALSRPQVVSEAGYELTDEQIEALATAVTDGAPEEEEAEGDDGDEEEEEEEEVEGKEEEVEEDDGVRTMVAESDVPEHDGQPLLSLDQR